MFIPYKIPSYMFLLTIDPDTLLKYGKLSCKVLRFIKTQARQKGVQHSNELKKHDFFKQAFQK